MESKHVKMSELIWEVVRPGVCRKVVHGEKGTVVVNKLVSGHEPKPHQHPHEQIAVILKGQSTFMVGENVYELEEGDVVVIPPNVVHFAAVTNGHDCINLDCFIPRREDYISIPTESASVEK